MGPGKLRCTLKKMHVQKIHDLIKNYVAQYPETHPVETGWQAPLLGVASAFDPLFERYKKIINLRHALPQELLPGAQSVIVFYIPFERELHKTNCSTDLYCSRKWAVAYIETNQLLADAAVYLQAVLEAGGHQAALVPPTHNFNKKTLLSGWSHRHAAFAAGLGRLGHHNLLITEKGCTGRLGSLVTDQVLEPSRRPEKEYCLHKAGYTCLKCVERCRFEALFPDRYDRFACYRQCRLNDRKYADLGLTEICGKCTALVPCSTMIPVK